MSFTAKLFRTRNGLRSLVHNLCNHTRGNLSTKSQLNRTPIFFHPHWFDNLIYTVHLNNGLLKRKYRAKVKKRVWKEIEAV